MQPTALALRNASHWQAKGFDGSNKSLNHANAIPSEAGLLAHRYWPMQCVGLATRRVRTTTASG